MCFTPVFAALNAAGLTSVALPGAAAVGAKAGATALGAKALAPVVSSGATKAGISGMQKLMIAQTGVSTYQGIRAEKGAKEQKRHAEYAAASKFDSSARTGAKVRPPGRKKPGRRGLYV